LTVGLAGGYSPASPSEVLTDASGSLGGVGASGISSAGVLGIDPVGIAVGGESITDLNPGLEQSGFGSAAGAGGSAAVVPDQQPSLFCPQLAFEPLVSGCQAILNPGTLGRLANTGSPALIALAGWLLIATGSLVYRRSTVRVAQAASQGGFRPRR
jgi:hypothetical protein